MTKDQTRIRDWRSTGRRIARRTLYQAKVPYACVGFTKNKVNYPCGKTVKEPPKDAPKWFDEIWPESGRVLDHQLEADHESKDYSNNNLDHINWRCKSCHRFQDQQTDKGVAQSTTNYWGDSTTADEEPSQYW